MFAVMNFEEFRKLTPHTHLLLVKPHGCWAEASGVYMSASHLDLTISYGYNGIKGVELCLVFFSVGSSMCNFCTYSLVYKFARLKYIIQMLCYYASVTVKQC